MNSKISSKTNSPLKTSTATGGKLSEEDEYLTAPEDMNDLLDGEHLGNTGRGHFPPQNNEKIQRVENMSNSGVELGVQGRREVGSREMVSRDGNLVAKGSVIGCGDIESGQSHLEERERVQYSSSSGRLHNTLSQREQHQEMTGERDSSHRDQHGNNVYRSFDKIRRTSKESSQRRSSANSRSSYGSRSHRDHHHRHGSGNHRSFRRSQDDQDEHSSDRFQLLTFFVHDLCK